jgi:Pyruvate/2-oxoacid:ferredoxin oxidoreductase delta subunit
MVQLDTPRASGAAPGRRPGAPEPEIPADDRGLVVVDSDLCKGCALCVLYCPPTVLAMSTGLNPHGYHPATYAGAGCTGCAICFYVCPEPGSITVYRREDAR